MLIIANAFSISMLEGDSKVSFTKITPQEAARIVADIEFDSAVGHADTAAIFSSTLGVEIPAQRKNITLRSGDAILVGQYIGPRLPEGTTKLPEGAKIEWWIIRKC